MPGTLSSLFLQRDRDRQLWTLGAPDTGSIREKRPITPVCSGALMRHDYTRECRCFYYLSSDCRDKGAGA